MLEKNVKLLLDEESGTAYIYLKEDNRMLPVLTMGAISDRGPNPNIILDYKCNNVTRIKILDAKYFGVTKDLFL